MTKSSAKLHVNKLAAAQRQLRAAIRMFFAGEDELAIHTVASAAYRILRDLKEKRGRNEAADYYLNAIFYVVRDYRRGTLPSYFTENLEAMAWIGEVAEKLPIEASTGISDIKASVSPEVAKAFFDQQNKYACFFKHADKDPHSTIPLDELDNLALLMQTLSAYIDLKSDDLGTEGMVFWLYSSVASGLSEGLPAEFQSIGKKLELLAPDKRLQLCSELVKELRDSS